MIIMGGPSFLMVVLALLMVKSLPDGRDVPIPCGRIFIFFGPVITKGDHMASTGARIHSDNTAEMTAMFKAGSFLGPRGLVTHDEQSRVYNDSMHVAGVCLATIQARTHVQLALACQRSMIRSQHRLWLTMQHFWSQWEFG